MPLRSHQASRKRSISCGGITPMSDGFSSPRSLVYLCLGDFVKFTGRYLFLESFTAANAADDVAL